MSDTFKVRVMGAGDGDHWYSDKVGEEFWASEGRTMYNLTKGHKGIMKSDCVIVEDEMETYTVNGVTYKQLEDITVKALIWVGARDMDADELTIGGWLDSRNSKIRGFSYLEVIPFDTALDYASSCSEYLLVLLVDQGFVEVVEEELKVDKGFIDENIPPRTGSGTLAGKAVWLNDDYSWTFEQDDRGVECLVPKRKH